MEKIIQISYQGRNISIEEKAYEIFQQYENELKNYFLKEDGGDETFTDLQYRMAEILEQKNNAGASPVTEQHILELINIIGKPSDLGAEPLSSSAMPNEDNEKKRLYRNKFKQGKMIAGVCSGIANYFNIDRIAVRLVFVLFTIFNIATFFDFNLGILAYVLLWIVLPTANLKDNITRKLFRNPKDKVLGGVCSGLAQFFNAETWVVRLSFVAPFLVAMFTSSWHWHKHGFHHVSDSFAGFSIITYLILWLIVPLAKANTDYMLLKGEPINISTIQNPTSVQEISQKSHTGMNRFLKVLAYVFLAFFLMVAIPSLISVSLVGFFSYHVANIILFSTLNKILALLIIFGLIIIPFTGFIIWVIRRLAGYRGKNRPIRVMFTLFNVMGWIALFALVLNLGKENTTYITKSESVSLPNTSDTLYVKALRPDSMLQEKVLFEVNSFDRLLHCTKDGFEIRGVRVRYKYTNDSLFSMAVERSAFGSNLNIASSNADMANYDYKVDGNNLFLSPMLFVTNKQAYHFQNIKVTIYIPKNKVILVSEDFRRQMYISVHVSDKHLEYRVEDNDDESDKKDNIIRINNDKSEKYSRIHPDNSWSNTDESNAHDAKQLFDEAQRDANQQIEETKRNLEQTKREVKQMLEAQRNLEQTKREINR
ncbi:MAG: hypothetical protein RIQ62_1364 [Bacteroidota bacterium]